MTEPTTAWEKQLKRDIEAAADEIKTSAFETFLSSGKLVSSARVIVDISPDCVVTVRYETTCFPRNMSIAD